MLWPSLVKLFGKAAMARVLHQVVEIEPGTMLGTAKPATSCNFHEPVAVICRSRKNSAPAGQPKEGLPVGSQGKGEGADGQVRQVLTSSNLPEGRCDLKGVSLEAMELSKASSRGCAGRSHSPIPLLSGHVPSRGCADRSAWSRSEYSALPVDRRRGEWLRPRRRSAPLSGGR